MLVTAPDQREKLYNKHLDEIGNTKFTFREIDIVACIVHNRGDKKIASLLLISHRTVGVHIRSIMGKIGCNSKDAIIDFVEKTGKLQYLRQYYFHLVVQSVFEQQLQKIAALVTRTGITSLISFDNATKEEERLIQFLRQHLKLANITLVNKSENNNLSNICVIGENTKSDYQYNTVRDIILLFDKTKESFIFDKISTINFYSNDAYYFSTLELIKKLINAENLENIIQEFRTEYENLQHSWHGQGKPGGGNKSLIPAISRIQKTHLIVLFILILVPCAFLLNKQYRQFNIEEVNHGCEEFMGSFSFENIGVTAGLKNNVDYLQKIGGILLNADHQSMLDYLISKNSTKKELLNYSYSLHAVAMDVLYNHYDALKARKLLEVAKSAVEKYLVNKYGVEINFEELTPEELFNELNTIDGFPEVYTRILYLLGRTYSYFEEYNRSNIYHLTVPIEHFERYYILSAYMGNKLKLFEGVLSIRNGAEIVRLLRIKTHIQNHEYQLVKDETLKSINVLIGLMQDNNTYITDYRSHGNNKTIIPANDNYWKLFLSEQIINHYARLINITQDKVQQIKYLGKIRIHCLGDAQLVGAFDRLSDIPPKKVACFYNSLGYVLLQLAAQEVDFSKFAAELRSKLHITAENDLDLILELFNSASQKSRKSYYPKTDSYNGMIQTFEFMLQRNRDHISEQQIQEIQNKINVITGKRDELNISFKKENM